ncbi:MAG: hypothetical protein EOO65_01410 [Methanosarcinales archaeon]|nr:MAG: hypothetical protein EOO65_01410 [Methanosarcinales archaeon]
MTFVGDIRVHSGEFFRNNAAAVDITDGIVEMATQDARACDLLHEGAVRVWRIRMAGWKVQHELHALIRAQRTPQHHETLCNNVF